MSTTKNQLISGSVAICFVFNHLVFAGVIIFLCFANIESCYANHFQRGRPPVKPRKISAPKTVRPASRANPLRSKFKRATKKKTKAATRPNHLRSKLKAQGNSTKSTSAVQNIRTKSKTREFLTKLRSQRNKTTRKNKKAASKLPVPALKFNSSNKLNQHAHNWGIGKRGAPPKNASKMMKVIAKRIHANTKTIHNVKWQNQPGVCRYHFDGKHAIVTRSDGSLVTILKNPGKNKLSLPRNVKNMQPKLVWSKNGTIHKTR